MNKLNTFLSVSLMLAAGLAHAQLDEVEPNDTTTTSNTVPLGESMSGQTCWFDEEDVFQVTLPTDGKLIIHTTVTDSDNEPQVPLSFYLISPDGSFWGGNVVVTELPGVPVDNTFEWCCLEANTYYLEVAFGYVYEHCFDYTFTFELQPATFGNNVEPNNSLTTPPILPYNTPLDGHLGFTNAPLGFGTDSDDYYDLVLPTDGTVRVFVESEAQSTDSDIINVGNLENSEIQSTPVGAFQSPLSDTLYWSCMAQDTMHIRIYSGAVYDGGYAYRIRYDMIAPVFANDVEPNNFNFAGDAQLVNPLLPIDGHEYFYGDNSTDFFKFAKPDTGFIKIFVQSETWDPTASGSTTVVLYDYNYTQLGTVNADIGVNGVPLLDSLYAAQMPTDTLYINVFNSSVFGKCNSYRLSLQFANSVGIGEKTFAESFSIYPNPTHGNFFIETQGNFGSGSLQVFNLFGEKVLDESMTFTNRNEVHLPNASPGIYFAKITLDGRQLLQKFVVE